MKNMPSPPRFEAGSSIPRTVVLSHRYSNIPLTCLLQTPAPASVAYLVAVSPPLFATAPFWARCGHLRHSRMIRTVRLRYQPSRFPLMTSYSCAFSSKSSMKTFVVFSRYSKANRHSLTLIKDIGATRK
tara:strand:- start:506 stop:892 length:387 start_codon:yes stop_codon:yes gene_type:complete